MRSSIRAGGAEECSLPRYVGSVCFECPLGALEACLMAWSSAIDGRVVARSAL